MKRVVVTGMGVAAPNGVGLKAFEQALREGKSGIEHIPELAEKKFSCQVAGVCPDIEEAAAEYFLNRSCLR